MGGFFGATSAKDVISDVFFGTDYHSHLGTCRGGMAAYDPEKGLQRKIHNIENSPFRTKFENIQNDMTGCAAIGCISDTDPQPILIRSKLGTYAICTIGIINNAEELVDKHLGCSGGYFSAMNCGKVNSNELIAAMINKKEDFASGIKYVQECIKGTASILILTEKGNIIAARDKFGRLPICIGKNRNGYCVSFESFAYKKLGYDDFKELGPGEIVNISHDNVSILAKPQEEMKICAFLWSYYGYPTSCYEGKNVEIMRYINGEIMAENDAKSNNGAEIDYVAGVPDSGTPHAIGYANKSKIPFARPFIKYTPTWPRSFMPENQSERNRIAKMKLIPVNELITGKKLLFVDDSVVRGTQLRETVEFLYENGAKEVHIRSACPPIMYGCKYLNFSRATSDMELIARSTIVEIEDKKDFDYLEEYANRETKRGEEMRNKICKKLHFSSLEFQSLDGIIKAIGLNPCKVCTYCWNGKG
jgi:amidophosphoribosyltransferase